MDNSKEEPKMTDFKIGDKVRRIGMDNGKHGACIGTIATVNGVDGRGCIGVYYPGCFDEGGGYEAWDANFAELFQEPQHENGKDKEEPKMTMDLKEAYLAMQEASGIKIGDTVRVLRKAGDWEMGWNNEWVDDDMDGYIGREWEVIGINGTRGVTLNKGWGFPFFVLEKVKDAPRFIGINGYDVPEPERKALECGEEYWTPDLHNDMGRVWHIWECDAFDNRYLSHGLVHKTKESAEIHAKALLSFTSKED